MKIIFAVIGWGPMFSNMAISTDETKNHKKMRLLTVFYMNLGQIFNAFIKQKQLELSIRITLRFYGLIFWK